MIKCKIYHRLWNIYNCSNFPYEEFYLKNQNNFITKGKSNKHKIYNMICSFDTESTTILMHQKEKDYAFTYIWGFKLNDYIIVGRYYQEFIIFLKKIEKIFNLTKNDKFLIFVHNLSYDFQFIYQFLKREFEFKIFATQNRKLLYCTAGAFEFRCSYKLTNMSLEKWCQKEKGVKYKKKIGTERMDYKKIIYPDDNLNGHDFRYFIGDLISLCDCIENKLLNEGNNLKTLPLTSTGYVRNYTKQETSLKDYKYRYYISRMTLTVNTYNMLNDVKIGGDTHANRFYQGELIDIPMLSNDIKSSYPYAECAMPVPVSNFLLYGNVRSVKELESVINDYCCMFYIYFDEIEIKAFNPKSVISISKIINNNAFAKTRAEIEIVDNGRLIKGKHIMLALTDVRWEHIKDNYNFNKIKIWNLYIAERGLIPYEYRRCVFSMFEEKCKLEKYKKTDREWEYDKYKNLLNATYGMCLTDIVHPEIILDDPSESDDPWRQEMTEPIEKQIEKYNKRWDRHLYYAWGIWIVDSARSNLYELIDCCNNPVYWDTDSCKGFNWDKNKLKAFNKKRENRLKELGFNTFIEGKNYPFGGYEEDGRYKAFKTLGAKKYCYEDDKGIHITIAGVSKKGAEMFESVNDFKVGHVFPSEYAGQCAKYNDVDFHFLKTPKGHKFETASNIALVDSKYELNASDDYLKRDTFLLLEVIN